ncbi:hypothetical protein N2152v2_003514 [Parachlorella kessleri]
MISVAASDATLSVTTPVCTLSLHSYTGCDIDGLYSITVTVNCPLGISGNGSPNPAASPAPIICTSVFFAMPRSPVSSSYYLAYNSSTAKPSADAFCRTQPGGFGGAGAYRSLRLPDSFASQASLWVTEDLATGEVCTGLQCEALGIVECIPLGAAAAAVDGLGNVGCRNSGVKNVGNGNSGTNSIGNNNQGSYIYGDYGTPYAA